MVDITQLSDQELLNIAQGNQISDISDEQLRKIANTDPQTGVAETITQQGLQGLTFGGADEIMSFIGAGIASGLTEESFMDLFREAQKMQNDRLELQRQERPGLSTASQIAGGVATGIAGAGTKLGSKAAKVFAEGATSAKIATGVASGASVGAVEGFLSADEGERLEGAATGAALGGVIGGTIPVVGDLLKSGINKVADGVNFTATGFKNKLDTGAFTTPRLAAADLEERAAELYQFASDKGGILKPRVINKVIAEIEQIKPQTFEGKVVVGREDTITGLIARIGELKNRPISLQGAKEIDEALGDMIDSFIEQGRVTKEGRKIMQIQSALRNNIERARPSDIAGGAEGFQAVKEARKFWSAARKLSDVERVITRASLTDNPASAIKTGFRTILTNPSKVRGFTKAERELMEKAARTGFVPDALRIFGSRLNPIIALGSGTGFGGTSAALAASTLSREAATRSQVGAARKVVEEIAGGVAGRPERIVPQVGTLGGTLPAITGLTGVE